MKVPTYDNLQVVQSAAPTPAFQQPSGPSGEQLAAQQMQGAGEAAQRAGGAASNIALDMQRDANEVRNNDAMNQAVNGATDLQVESHMLKGRDAMERPDGKSLPDEFSEKLQKRFEAISESLANPAQKRAFALSSGKLGVQFRSSLTTHMLQQQDVYKDETAKAGLDVEQRRGVLLRGDANIVKQSTQTITNIVDSIAKRKGMSPEARDMALAESLSPMHVGIMKGMIQAGQANGAKTYYDDHSASMTLQARAAMQGVIKEASDTQTGEQNADAVWATTGPKDMNEPVKIFDMERELRTHLKDNPDASKRGIEALRQRAQAFNGQQAEVNAAGVNGVFKLLDGGTPMTAVMRSNEWLSLPDLKKHEIRKTLQNEAHQAEQRAFTHEQRVFAGEQRAERSLLLSNGDAYLRYSDPDVLTKMTRPQVEATRTVFGFEGAQHLLGKFDSLTKAPEKIVEARMDKQDFDHVAEQMGLDPFNAKSPDKKAQLGELQFKVEQLINAAQVAKKGALTRDEKMTLMTGELGRQVTVNPGLFSFSKQVPVIQMGAKDVARVVVPQADKAQIAADMAKRLSANPNDARFLATEENVRYWFLRSRSRAADLIPETKK